jgi:hypothetical protein
MKHLEHPIRGHVRSVRSVRLGDVLAADASASDAMLTLENVEDFDEVGGFILLDDTEQAEYTAVDFDLNTLTLAAGIGSGYESGTSVTMYPDVIERRALVEIDDSDQDDEVLDVRVPHALYLYLPEGVRDRVD